MDMWYSQLQTKEERISHGKPDAIFGWCNRYKTGKESKAPDERHNSDRVFCGAGERERMDRNILLCVKQGKISAKISGTSQRDTVARYDPAGIRDAVAGIIEGVSEAME